MKTTDVSRIKSRYFSIRNEGQEFYVEDIGKTMSENMLKQIALKKLHLIRQAMPSGQWTILIEQEVRDGKFGDRQSHYESFNPETGEEMK